MNLAIRRLCEGLSLQGQPTDVFVRREDRSSPDEELIAPMSRLVRLPIGPTAPVAKWDVRALCDEFAARVLDHAESEGRWYRLVHAHYWLGGVVARTLRSEWGSPWVQSFHTLARTKARAGLPLDAVRSHAEGQIIGEADRLVAGSVSEAKDLIRLYGASRDRICVAQPGVDPRAALSQRPARLRRRLHLEGRRVVLFCGRLEPLKGADTLVDAIAALTEDPSFSDVSVLVVGEDSGDAKLAGGERARLQELVRDSGMGERVRFLGAVPHERVGDYYAVADVCVVPSRTESFGLVALEAQSLGTPVVAAAVGGLAEIVVDGVTGFLVRGRDPRRYADAIATVLSDPARRRAMGDAARERAARFTWTRAVDRLLAIYARLTDAARPALSPCGYADDEVAALRSAS
jgi:D-inositol-3-phosphate glycosyltransferase